MLSNTKKQLKDTMSDIKKDSLENINDTDDHFRLAFKTLLRNEHHTFVVQKTEKLASALYMVTGFIPTEDPLRTRLRTCAVDLVSTCSDPDKAQNVRYHNGFSSRCLEIGSILKLAERAGFVSSMNARILCDEYAELASFVNNHHTTIFGHEPIEVGSAPAMIASKKITGLEKSYVSRTQTKTAESPQKKLGTNSKRHNNRRDSILRLLDKKDKISIKDAVSAIEGCSEKTIQRELVSLVQDGVLLKEGERRWSTYRKA